MNAMGNAVIAVGRRRSLQLLVMDALVLVLCTAGAGQATTIVVDSPGDDTTINGNCTLREAVIAANSDTAVDACAAGSGADVITVPAGTYLLTLVGSGEDAAATGDLDVTEEVELQGGGAASTIVDGNLADRVFDIDPGALGIAVQISGVTIRNGAQVSAGGGIDNGGTLTVADSTVRSNRASSDTNARGGGIRNAGTLTLIRSTIAGNTVEGTTPTNPFVGVSAWGGGIQSDGSAVITASTVDGNSAIITSSGPTAASIEGGGIAGPGPISIDASTVSNNTVDMGMVGSGFGGGGGISGGSELEMTNSTISGNEALEMSPTGFAFGGGVAAGTAAFGNCTLTGNYAPIGGGLFVFNSATFRNTIMQGGCETTAPSITDVVTADAYNLEGGNTCGFSGTDQTGVAPLLGPLQDNGGPAFTHALLPMSPAREAGSPAVPGSGGTACEADDQRGVTRPQRARCDVGSVEVGPCPTTPLAGCDAPGKSLLLIKDRGGDGAGPSDKLIWKWLKGPATAQVDFGNPAATADYTLCIYAGTPQTVTLEAFVPAGGTCASAACWKALGTKGYRRSDVAAGAGGMAKIILKGGASAKIIAKGKGSSLDLVADTLPLPGVADVIVQLSNSDNANCWQSTFPAASVKENSDKLFKAKTP